MNSEEQQEDLNEERGQPENGPGHLLAKKREALGMSVQDVADTLHITMHYVHALETDEHDKLPGDVFIKGYLRSYASLLRLDPTVIVNVYLEYSSDRVNVESESSTRRHIGNNRRIPWIVVSGVAFVGMAIALWFFNSDSPSPARPTGAAAAANTPNVTTRTLRPGVAATLDQVATSVEVPSMPEQLTQSMPSPVAEEQAAPEIALTLQEELAPGDATAATDEVQDQLGVQSAESEPQDELRLISVDGGGEDYVQFTFTGASWVQVDDANDEQLYGDERGAGDVLRITGTAPFNILLGDASNSELSFNGAMVDFSASIRADNTARLTIGL